MSNLTTHLVWQTLLHGYKATVTTSVRILTTDRHTQGDHGNVVERHKDKERGAHQNVKTDVRTKALDPQIRVYDSGAIYCYFQVSQAVLISL